MKVLVPCCGGSTRYGTTTPKWMLPSADGRPMLALAVERLGVAPSSMVVAILREHEDAFDATAGIRSALGAEVQVVVHERPTANQPETVARTLELAELREPFLVKDSDNQFVVDGLAEDVGAVCVDSLNHHDAINPRNKSYVQVDRNGLITNIREKSVISDLFSVGGYFFPDPDHYLACYRRLAEDGAADDRELYLSDVIGSMILEGVPFRAHQVKGYEDWGTIREWRQALERRRVCFVSLDGFLFERGSPHFRPTFAEVRPHRGAVDAVRALVEDGRGVVYLSVRPADLAGLTEAQIAAAGLPPAQVVYGCPPSRWTIVTAPDPTLPFVTSTALEADPDDPNLLEKIAGPE
jgi:hypothetical protein